MWLSIKYGCAKLTFQSKVPAKECPRCGNLDYDDDFVVIRCSKCHDAYFAHEAKDSEIVI